jgi:hypothetical protein
MTVDRNYEYLRTSDNILPCQLSTKSVKRFRVCMEKTVESGCIVGQCSRKPDSPRSVFQFLHRVLWKFIRRTAPC